MTSEIILIGGSECSGRSRLAKSLVDELYTQMSIEHLAVGDIIRNIGRGALASFVSIEVSQHLNGPNVASPINDDVMYTIVSEALTRHSGADVILLDGYPRFVEQVDHLDDIAILDDRAIAGMIVTQTSEDEAIMRMLKRRNRPFTPQLTAPAARERLHESIVNSELVVAEYHERNIPVEFVNTSHSKIETTDVGLYLVKRLLNPGTKD